jgi:hypothetical protein
MIERLPRRLAPGVDGEAHRTELHLGDRVKAVSPARRGRQAGDETCLHFREHSLERCRRDVMAFVDNHMPITCDQVVDATNAHETLDHRHIELAGRSLLAGTNLPDAAMNQHVSSVSRG